jgi:acyl-CoA reductase-like NAD-dependent aldehyde dehydrogenase
MLTSSPILARDADELAEVETRDTGKLLREMRGQLGTIPGVFNVVTAILSHSAERPAGPA